MARPPKTDEKRREIVRHAAKLFDSLGYEHVSMDQIAEAVGLRKPSLYHYVANKHELLYLINDQFLTQLICWHEARLEAGLRPSELLLECMSDILALMHEHRGHAGVFFEYLQDLTPAQRQEVEKLRNRYHRCVLEVVRQGVRQGEFRTPDPELTTLGLFGMCSWAYTWYRPQGRLTSREVAHHFWHLLMDGLRTPEPKTPSETTAS